MPFESSAQRSFMRTQHPAIAERWEDFTPDSPRLSSYTKWATSNENIFRIQGQQSALQHLGLVKKHPSFLDI